MPRVPKLPYQELNLPGDNIAFDVERLEQFIRSHGVTCEVYSAMYCPIEVTDANANRIHNHGNCQNGFLYRYEGKTTVSFTGNVTAPDMTESGVQDNSMVMATFPLYYDDCPDKAVVLGQFYRIYISDCPTAVVNSEKIEHHASGTDKPSYPIEKMLRLADNHGKEYHEGADYDIVDGLIKWKPNKSPGIDVDLNRGNIISMLYTYKPFYYVSRLPHEIRVSRRDNPMTGEAEVLRMQTQVALQREWMFDQAVRDNDGKGTARTAAAPRSGGFGPR